MKNMQGGTMKKKLLTVLAVLCILGFSLCYYAFNIEPFLLCEETITLEGGQSDDGRTVRIVQFSDTHFKKDFPAENMARIARRINALHPDLVIFSGDLYDDYSRYHDDSALIEALSSIQAPLGKLAVWGNRDYGGGAQKAYLSILDASGFTLLQNSNWYIPLESGRTILFTGLDDALLGHPSMPEQTKTYDSDYNILLLHEPDAIHGYDLSDYDLAISGHTHGGQTSLPLRLLSAEKTPSLYWGGLYETGQTLLFVNTGIGTTHISARLGMPPRLSILELPL